MTGKSVCVSSESIKQDINCVLDNKKVDEKEEKIACECALSVFIFNTFRHTIALDDSDIQILKTYVCIMSTHWNHLESSFLFRDKALTRHS